MGGGDSEFEQKMDVNDAERLKYLGFVQAAALHTILCFASLYAYAKDKSGPLKPGVESVEGAVKTVVAPVYLKFHDVPIELLKFVDRKMNESVNKLDNRIPPVVKRVSTQALCAAQKAPEVARGLVSEVQREGVMGTAKNTADGVMCVAKNTALNTALSAYAKYEPVAKELYSKYEPAAKELYSKYEPAAKELYSKYEPAAKELYSKYEPAAKEIYTKYEPAAKELYSKYEPVAERYVVSAWQKLNQLPLFPIVADAVLPTAAYCSEKYNQTVRSKAEDGYTVASYLPLVPTDKIAKVFSAQNHEVETEIPVS